MITARQGWFSILCLIGLITLIGILLLNSKSNCGQACVAAHMVISASKWKDESLSIAAGAPFDTGRKIEGLYITYGRLIENGEVLLVNLDEGVILHLTPTSAEDWKCTIYPEKLERVLDVLTCSNREDTKK